MDAFILKNDAHAMISYLIPFSSTF